MFKLTFYYNTHYDKQGNINFDGKDYIKSEDISMTSNDELLEEFKSIVKPLYEKDNLDNHLKVNKKRVPSGGDNRFFEDTPNLNWHTLQINRYKAGPYAIITNTDELNNKIGIYKNYFTDNKRMFYFAFITDKELCNAISYFKTFFARCCLYLSMHNDELVGGGALKTVPWFNFSNPAFSKSPSEIDDYLFKKYGISNEIRKHAENILTDYYSIRKKSAD